MRNYTPYEIKNKVYKVAEMLDLITYIDKLPKELSGGQMQRVALGRAIVKNVPIFLMDEPLSNLDAKLRLTMRSEIVKLHNSIDATTIYVTHDQTEAMTMATRIVVMSRGFIQQIGTPEEVYNNPNNVFVAKFIGSPAMNFFTVNYNREKNSFMFGEKEISAPDDFSKKCQNFYKDKNTEFQNLVENFDEEAKIRLLKTLSGTGEYQIKQTKQESKTFVERIKSLFKKKEEQKIPNELEICKEKLEILKKYNSGEVSSLLVGIRPERLSITKCTDTSNTENGFILKPTLCELLGSEYNVHCSIAGQNLIGRFDAIEKISTNDYIQVSFDKNSLYIFDPITGEIIK